MLEQSGQHAFDYRLHGGSAVRMQWHFFGQSELPVAVQTWELPPGGYEGMHAHTDQDGALEEIYIVTEGNGRLEIDGGTFDVSVGDAVLAKVGATHDLHNTGAGPLKLVVVWGAPGASDFSNFGSAQLAQQVRETA
ncbi:cupin domain-containing protein [Paenarthrobacter sp. Z7-10]|uniref:cupin domain-containing protein n=1 Tax=Paenarthrobacter sp. Z7-10 TaxID=2787635 RepID=UPI0022A97A1B|nr:cupin domain-containing protein [Paenarthrobacter sp. Z7-10]MCZ2404036.1 cupin domain-containing protein [Paenarthrobacter sp. Z7-10]